MTGASGKWSLDSESEEVATKDTSAQSACMKPILSLIAVAALFLSTENGRAETAATLAKVGEEYEITKSYETSEQSSDGASSSSSSGSDTILERVIAVSESGLELEYDLPKDATAEDRSRHWEFPARIQRPPSGPMRLLNGHELEARIEGWLKAAKWTREICGRWIFTWNAFRIDCDPQSVIKTIQAYDLRSADVREGALYRVTEAREPGTLAKTAAGPTGATFIATMEADPDAYRRSRAEADVAVGELIRKPVTLEAALRERAKEGVSGTITVTFETDSAGHLLRLTKVTKLETKLADGRSESRTAKEIVERRLVSSAASNR